MNDRRCQIPEHNNKPIISFCVSEFCRKQNRALCMKCINDHQGHENIDDNEEGEFLNKMNFIYLELQSKLSLIKRQFSRGINQLEQIIEKNYRPMPFNNIGNQDITTKINCMLKIEKIQKLVNDRIDNIFEHTLKSIKQTYQDLTIGKENLCYELILKSNYQEASTLIEQCLATDSKNSILKLAQAEILQNNNRNQEARMIYEQILSTDDANPWAFFEITKINVQQERR